MGKYLRINDELYWELYDLKVICGKQIDVIAAEMIKKGIDSEKLSERSR